jgi:hypothetical protein
VLSHPTVGQWLALIALSAVWAWIGYRLSEKDRRVLGRTPWGLPSAVWALFWFLSLVVGVVFVGLLLYLIAHSTSVRRAHEGQPSGMRLPGPGRPVPTSARATPAKGPTASDLFPAYPRPANNQPPAPAEPERSEAPDDPAPPDPDAPSWTHSPPAWQPDPSGRFHYRWWDGTQWTSHVSTDGHPLIDTNPDQRIGPY